MDGIGTVAQSNPSQAPANAAATQTKVINLALQGGGAHGAFTWGVLDQLLDEERVVVEGISATSAGAMNAAVFTYGYAMGGRAAAKATLLQFWRRISHAAMYGPLQPSWLDRAMGNHSLSFSPAFVLADLMTRLFSPYEFNVFDVNPLRNVLEASVDFAALRKSSCPIKLFLSATNVRTGKVRVFERHEICADRVLASGCLPFLFKAVEIDGEHYWDGGYTGNPAIFPLIYNCDSRDVVVVHINPLERPDLPRTASEIRSRIDEISFNSSLMREMRAISFVTSLIDSGAISSSQLKRIFVHAIAADDVMTGLGASSKLNADWGFLQHLRDAGRSHAKTWIETCFERLGRESTVDIRQQYL
jgi:NTE family protein